MKRLYQFQLYPVNYDVYKNKGKGYVFVTANNESEALEIVEEKLYKDYENEYQKPFKHDIIFNESLDNLPEIIDFISTK